MKDSTSDTTDCADGSTGRTTIDRRHYLGLLGTGATVGLLGGVGGLGGSAAAQANGDGSTLGGGPGYSNTVSESEADYVANSVSDLRNQLDAASSGDVVYVEGSATLDLGSNVFGIDSGVTLASDRGIDGAAGALLRTDSEPDQLFEMEQGSRLTGLRLEGPHPGGDTSGDGSARAVLVSGNDVEIDNCDVSAFSYAGIYVNGGDGHVHHNVIRECNKSGLGYGISMVSGNPVIEFNYFDFNRHSVATDGSHYGYVCRYNHFGPDLTSHVIDMHDPAGARYEVHNNVVQGYVDTSGEQRPAVAVRGVPDDVALIEDNWFWNPERPRDSPSYNWTNEAIIQPEVDGSYWQSVNFSGNHYGENAGVGYSDVISGYDGNPASGGDGGTGGGGGGDPVSGERLQVIPTGGEVANYSVVVDGDVSMVTSGSHNAGDADSLSSNDDGTTTISGATGSGQQAGGDTFDLGGDVLAFSTDNPLAVTLDGASTSVDALDANPDKFTLIPSGGEIVEYTLAVDGSVSAIEEGPHNAGDSDPITEHGDGTVTVDGATGDQQGDMWRIDGEITGLSIDQGSADTWVNGSAVSPSDFGAPSGSDPGQLLEVSRAADSSGTVNYIVETDGEVQDGTDAGTGGVNDHDEVGSASARGSVGGGTDPYLLVDATRVSVATFGGDVTTTLDGEEVDLTGWTSL